MQPADPDTALDAARQAHARGDHAPLVRHAGTALAQAEATHDERAIAEASLLLSRGLFGLGRYAVSIQHGRRARRAWQALGDAAQACAALRVVAHSLTEAGALDLALAAAREAFDTAEANRLLDEALQLMVLVGTLLGRLNEFHDGEALLMQALSRARERRRDDYDAMATSALLVLMVQAREVHLREGRAERADAAARQLERHALHLRLLAQAETHRGRRAVYLGNAGEALATCGRTEAATQALEESLGLAREQGLAVVELAALVRRARLQLSLGHLDAAAGSMAELQQALQAAPHAEAQEDLHALQALLHRRQGREGEAALLEDRVAHSRAERERRAAGLRAELGQEADAWVLPARLHALETGQTRNPG